MIELVNVTKVLSSKAIKTVVLANASVVLPAHKRIVILGGPGSGKTSLIRMLAGHMLPNHGEINRRSRVSFPIGFLGNLKRTSREHIRHVAGLYGTEANEVLSFISALPLPGIDRIMRQPLAELPQQTRLSLAYALGYAIPFDVYLFDGTIMVGNAEFRRACLAMFQERARTSGMVLATRNVQFARQFGEIIGIIDQGCIAIYEDATLAIASFKKVLAREAVNTNA